MADPQHPKKVALPVGPVVDDACAHSQGCKRPRAEHREDFMDLREGVIDHDFVAPAPRPYDHERVHRDGGGGFASCNRLAEQEEDDRG